MPLHDGHLFLIGVAADLVDELTVLVCSRDCETIDGRLRLGWMRKSVKRTIRVLHLHQDIPQEPNEHPEFWNIWRKVIKEYHPDPIDLVFGSDMYVVRLAKELDAKPFVVDEPREIIPISATQIRENPYAYWQYIPKTVRAYYQKRVCILGPESTGKSQLSQYLAKQYHTRFVPEYGRSYDKVYKQGKNWQSSDFMAIALGQLALRRQIAQRAGYIFFEDTDLLQTIVWAEYLLGEVPVELTHLVQNMKSPAFYLLLSPDVAWQNDGTRYSGNIEVRDWFFRQLESLLKFNNLPHRVISGTDWRNRCESAKTIVHQLDKFISTDKQII
jgi:NadR type nicotinamide-nucleotide adenylyltransferase